MAKLDAVFKSNKTLQRSVEYGCDTFNDGRTALQNYNYHFISKHYGVIELVDMYMCDGFLVAVCSCKCGRLVRFTINPLGLYRISVVPVFGGTNTPFTFVFPQLSKIKIN